MNKYAKSILKVSMVILPVLVMVSCKDLTNLNVNHNSPTLQASDPAFLTTTVLTKFAKKFVELGYWDPFAGVMQYTQKAGFSGEGNTYDWSNRGWGYFYSLLRTNHKAYERAKKLNKPFIAGESLVMKSFIYGLVTSLWGDAPYNVFGGKTIDSSPVFTPQKKIFSGVISDLKKAENIFEGLKGENIPDQSADVYYNGDPMEWAKFANSLLLRYYMRISSKLPDVAQKGIESIVQSGVYFKSNQDDATMGFPGTNGDNSWPENVKFDNTSGTNFRRIQMCATFINKLEALNDPRLGIFAEKIQIPIVISAAFSSSPDIVINGVRYIHPDNPELTGLHSAVDTDPNYVGLPPGLVSPSWYNLNPTPGQQFFNPSVSYMNFQYKKATGPLLKAHLESYADVCFILSEAALKGWSVGKSAEQWYNDGVKTSLNTWGVGDDYSTYISRPSIAFKGTVKQIELQKWIANWTMAEESWFSYRRTGFPDLKAGPQTAEPALPLRFMYPGNEYLLNQKNTENALNSLKTTQYSGAQGKDSPWSKMWLLQGTSEPW